LIGFEQLLRDADEALFQKVLNVEHCLNNLLPGHWSEVSPNGS